VSVPTFTGSLVVVGTGPGRLELMTPATAAALAHATDLVGYGPYLDRVPRQPGQCRHASDNRRELDRARLALSLAACDDDKARESGSAASLPALSAGSRQMLLAGDDTGQSATAFIADGGDAEHRLSYPQRGDHPVGQRPLLF